MKQTKIFILNTTFEYVPDVYCTNLFLIFYAINASFNTMISIILRMFSNRQRAFNQILTHLPVITFKKFFYIRVNVTKIL